MSPTVPQAAPSKSRSGSMHGKLKSLKARISHTLSPKRASSLDLPRPGREEAGDDTLRRTSSAPGRPTLPLVDIYANTDGGTPELEGHEVRPPPAIFVEPPTPGEAELAAAPMRNRPQDRDRRYAQQQMKIPSPRFDVPIPVEGPPSTIHPDGGSSLGKQPMAPLPVGMPASITFRPPKSRPRDAAIGAVEQEGPARVGPTGAVAQPLPWSSLPKDVLDGSGLEAVDNGPAFPTPVRDLPPRLARVEAMLARGVPAQLIAGNYVPSADSVQSMWPDDVPRPGPQWVDDVPLDPALSPRAARVQRLVARGVPPVLIAGYHYVPPSERLPWKPPVPAQGVAAGPDQAGARAAPYPDSPFAPGNAFPPESPPPLMSGGFWANTAPARGGPALWPLKPYVWPPYIRPVPTQGRDASAPASRQGFPLPASERAATMDPAALGSHPALRGAQDVARFAASPVQELVEMPTGQDPRRPPLPPKEPARPDPHPPEQAARPSFPVPMRTPTIRDPASPPLPPKEPVVTEPVAAETATRPSFAPAHPPVAKSRRRSSGKATARPRVPPKPSTPVHAEASASVIPVAVASQAPPERPPKPVMPATPSTPARPAAPATSGADSSSTAPVRHPIAARPAEAASTVQLQPISPVLLAILGAQRTQVLFEAFLPPDVRAQMYPPSPPPYNAFAGSGLVDPL